MSAPRTDGPVADQMREHVAAALAGHHFTDMRDRKITCHRGESPRTWAARAIASRRDGSLARADAEGAAWRRAHPSPYVVANSDLTPEHYAMLQYVEQLIRDTPYPGRPSAPEDEPLIEQLLAAAGRNAGEYAMTRILVNADRAPADGKPQLRAVVPGPGAQHLEVRRGGAQRGDERTR
ncbi:hypothetical protein ACIQFZ_29150 [Streptomyces sp. NPDC093064]|uniref:hypothetical protein n=1 Tax=Streptomyces sp. NPDC093064 TaxID=3366020 RepID=UPI0037FF3CD7